MLVSGGMLGKLADIPAAARDLEAQGADIAMAVELGNDPMTQLALAATVTGKIRLMTGITVAFARSPMTLAQTAHGVNSLSQGRLMLGIGSSRSYTKGGDARPRSRSSRRRR